MGETMVILFACVIAAALAAAMVMVIRAARRVERAAEQAEGFIGSLREMTPQLAQALQEARVDIARIGQVADGAGRIMNDLRRLSSLAANLAPFAVQASALAAGARAGVSALRRFSGSSGKRRAANGKETSHDTTR